MAHVIVDGVLTKTLALTMTPAQRARLQGAYLPGPAPRADRHPETTQRRVSAHGTTMVIGQKIQVGLRHAGRTVTIEIHERDLHVLDEHDEVLLIVPRTNTKTVTWRKAYSRPDRTAG